MTRLLVFDSGIGGLSVVREIRRSMPEIELIYLADDAGFPYGAWEGTALSDHVVSTIAEGVERFAPDAMVIACNTASTLVLPRLRAQFSLPIIGTVPAIKPATARTKSGLISVLATVGTIQRDYTRDLIQSYAQRCDVCLVGSSRLAVLAETHLAGGTVEDAELLSEIAPAFVEDDSRRTDTIVLACTHYPFLVERFRRVAPWPVEWIDPASAIARRVVALLGRSEQGLYRAGGGAFLTSGKAWPAASEQLLAGLALSPG